MGSPKRHWGLTDTATRTKHMDRGTKCCTAIFHSFPLSTFYLLSTFALSYFFSLLIIPMLLHTANVLLFDAPVGAGFSFATTSEVRSLERIRHNIGSSSLSVSEKCECNWWWWWWYIYIYIKSIKMFIGNFKLDLIALLAPSSKAWVWVSNFQLKRSSLL